MQVACTTDHPAPLVWDSFWDIADPKSVSVAIMDYYGAAACCAVLDCVKAAEADERHDDQRFWIATLSYIHAANKARREAEQARWEAQGIALI